MPDDPMNHFCPADMAVVRRPEYALSQKKIEASRYQLRMERGKRMPTLGIGVSGMYNYLNTHGKLYYIQYRGTLVGDVCLRDNDEVCIVVCKAYQNRHIGRRCITEMIHLAKEQGLKTLKAHIYSFNTQSQAMFLAAGFYHTEGEWYELDLT